MVKESLGEYGSGWEWDYTWPKVFDYEKSFTRVDEYGQTYVEYYPARYNNTISTIKPTINGTWVNYGSITSKESSEKCPIETTNGEILNSGSVMSRKVSCRPHAFNAGGLYNQPAAIPERKAQNSICSIGWKIPENDSNKNGFYDLINHYFDASSSASQTEYSDTALLSMPLSYIRTGRFSDTGIIYNRSEVGYYRGTIYTLYFYQKALNVKSEIRAYDGFSLRC